MFGMGLELPAINAFNVVCSSQYLLFVFKGVDSSLLLRKTQLTVKNDRVYTGSDKSLIVVCV